MSDVNIKGRLVRSPNMQEANNGYVCDAVLVEQSDPQFFAIWKKPIITSLISGKVYMASNLGTKWAQKGFKLPISQAIVFMLIGDDENHPPVDFAQFEEECNRLR